MPGTLLRWDWCWGSLLLVCWPGTAAPLDLESLSFSFSAMDIEQKHDYSDGHRVESCGGSTITALSEIAVAEAEASEAALTSVSLLQQSVPRGRHGREAPDKRQLDERASASADHDESHAQEPNVAALAPQEEFGPTWTTWEHLSRFFRSLWDGDRGASREVLARVTGGWKDEVVQFAYLAAKKLNDGKQSYGSYLLFCFISWLIWMALAALIARCFYHVGWTPERNLGSQANPAKTLESGHFGCLEDSDTCVWAFVCLGIRWADTVSMAKLTGFWKAFLLLGVLGFLNCILRFGGFYAWGVFTACALLYYRQGLRRQLGLSTWAYPTVFLDCAFVLLCPFCAVAQEARVVREAQETGCPGFA